jgi:hypothetical protein
MLLPSHHHLIALSFGFGYNGPCVHAAPQRRVRMAGDSVIKNVKFRNTPGALRGQRDDEAIVIYNQSSSAQ